MIIPTWHSTQSRIRRTNELAVNAAVSGEPRRDHKCVGRLTLLRLTPEAAQQATDELACAAYLTMKLPHFPQLEPYPTAPAYTGHTPVMARSNPIVMPRSIGSAPFTGLAQSESVGDASNQSESP
jgi:hypothetical protein